MTTVSRTSWASSNSHLTNPLKKASLCSAVMGWVVFRMFSRAAFSTALGEDDDVDRYTGHRQGQEGLSTFVDLPTKPHHEASLRASRSL